MRISDWSSDVCSSDLPAVPPPPPRPAHHARRPGVRAGGSGVAAGAASASCVLRDARPGDAPAVLLRLRSIFDGVKKEPSGEEPARSEERRAGKERVSTCGVRGSPCQKKNK